MEQIKIILRKAWAGIKFAFTDRWDVTLAFIFLFLTAISQQAWVAWAGLILLFILKAFAHNKKMER